MAEVAADPVERDALRLSPAVAAFDASVEARGEAADERLPLERGEREVAIGRLIIAHVPTSLPCGATASDDQSAMPVSSARVAAATSSWRISASPTRKRLDPSLGEATAIGVA